MKILLIVSAVIGIASVSHASGSDAVGVTFAPTLMTSVAPSFTTASTFNGGALSKEVLAAKEDIAYFVASNGKVRTAQFDRAMASIREYTGNQTAQDMEFANAVLAELQ
jgi:uncharacterized protein (TIGR02448 family)